MIYKKRSQKRHWFLKKTWMLLTFSSWNIAAKLRLRQPPQSSAPWPESSSVAQASLGVKLQVLDLTVFARLASKREVGMSPLNLRLTPESPKSPRGRQAKTRTHLRHKAGWTLSLQLIIAPRGAVPAAIDLLIARESCFRGHADVDHHSETGYGKTAWRVLRAWTTCHVATNVPATNTGPRTQRTGDSCSSRALRGLPAGKS